jgi:transposase-like protein
MRRVPERLARDFWVRPSEASIRLWCRAYRTHFDVATDSLGRASILRGLCVDEVYQGQLAFLFAVDPAAPMAIGSSAADTLRRQARQAKHDQVRALAEEGHAYCAIAQQVRIHRVTVSKWLNQVEPADPTHSPAAPPERTTDADTPPAPQPPLPWQQWDAVRQVREELQEHRYRFLRRADHLTADQQAQIARQSRRSTTSGRAALCGAVVSALARHERAAT